MKKMLLALVLAAAPVLAHEGAHGPAQKVAPHGGILRDGSSLMMELVKEGGNIKIYPLTHDGKAIEAKILEVDTKKTMLIDSKKKPVAYTLLPEGNAFTLKFQGGSSYRHAFGLVVRYEGKENKTNWQIETQAE